MARGWTWIVVAGVVVALVAVIVAGCPSRTSDAPRPQSSQSVSALRTRETRRVEAATPAPDVSAPAPIEVVPPPAVTSEGKTVRGRVILADTRAPAADVAVRAWAVVADRLVECDRERRTGADGRFEIAGVTAGAAMSVYAVKPGFRTADWSGDVAAGLDLELVLGEGGVLEGTVFDEIGRAMPGVDVFLLQPERPVPPPDIGGEEASGTVADRLKFIFCPTATDQLGRYRFVGLRLSTDEKAQPRCAVARDADGREARSDPAEFRQVAERQVRDVRFVAPGALRVVVKGAPSQPLIVYATLHPAGVSQQARELDEKTGDAVFDRVAAGRWWVVVVCPDWSWQLRKDDVEVRSGETTVVAFDVGATKTLTGRVVDDLGAGVPSLSVDFSSDAPDMTQSARATTDKEGRFTFHALVPTPGHVMVDVAATGAASAGATLADSSRVEATPGGEPVTVVMKRATTLAGWVTPVPSDRRVQFDIRADDTTTQESTDVRDDGSFTYEIPASGERVFVTLSATGAAPIVVVDGSAPAGKQIDLGRLTLDAGVTLNLTLHDAEGHALAGAEVDCLDFFLHGRSATADAEGRIRIDGVPRHALRLLVHETATTPMARPVIADPTAPPAVLTIPAGALVTGHVVDGAGKALTDAVVISFRRKSEVPDPDGKTTWAWTETDGAYRVRLEPALYRVLVRDKNQGQLSDSVDLAVADGETRTLELRLR